MQASHSQLPTEVKEQSTAKTSVYRQGHLVYDGATGEYVDDEHGEAGKRHGFGPGMSLNEMLKWSIENSDPAELARRADDSKVQPPSQLDREILDMLLGEPIVAKMRECLGKLERSELSTVEGLDAGNAALEELEYYAEDLDHAIDLAKIGGLAVLKRCCAFGLLDGEGLSSEEAAEEKLAAENGEDAACLREAACGVLAAALQNNPKVARAAAAIGVQTMLLAMLSGGGVGASAARVGGVGVVRKALLALSALLRTTVDDPGEEATEAAKERKIDLTDADSLAKVAAEAAQASATLAASKMAAVDAALPTLCALSAHPDLKVRRRAIFLLASLAAASPQAAAAIAAIASARVVAASAADADASAAGSPLLNGLLGALSDEDEDLRTQSQRLLLGVRASADGPGADGSGGAEAAAALARKLAECAGAAVIRQALQKSAEAGAEAVDPEEGSRLRQLLEWVEKA